MLFSSICMGVCVFACLLPLYINADPLDTKAFQVSPNNSIALEITKLEKQRQEMEDKEQKQKEEQQEKQVASNATAINAGINSEVNWIKDLVSKASNTMRNQCSSMFRGDSDSNISPKLNLDALPSSSLDKNLDKLLATGGLNIKDLALSANHNNAPLKHVKHIQGNQQNKQNTNSVFYVFVTLSMTLSNLKDLIEETSKYKGIVVIRGLKDNSMLETVKYLTPLLKNQNEGLIIDPTLFRKYKIDKVPSFVLTRICDPLGDRVTLGSTLSDNTTALKNNASHTSSCTESYDILKGNVSPRFALLQMLKKGDLKQEASQLIR